MRILVTVSDMKRLALVIDLESGKIDSIPVDPAFIDPDIVGRAHCRPFGITWSQHELFIANNRQLLVFDKQLGFLRTKVDIAFCCCLEVTTSTFSGEL